MLLTFLSGKRVFSRLRTSVCQVITHECDQHSLKRYLMEDAFLSYFDELFNRKERMKEFAALPNDFDSIGFAYKFLYTACFHLLSSGKYHLYHGFLNPVGEAMCSIFPYVLNYYVSSGLLPESEVSEQKSILADNIAAVG